MNVAGNQSQKKTTTIKNHITCKKLRDNKAIFKSAGEKRQQILDSMVEFQQQTGVVGIKTLTDEEHIFRDDIMVSF